MLHIYIYTHTHTHIYIYIHIHIYMCVCVCVCVSQTVSRVNIVFYSFQVRDVQSIDQFRRGNRDLSLLLFQGNLRGGGEYIFFKSQNKLFK